MIVIPIRGTRERGGRGPIVLVLVLAKENLDRMRDGDPVDFQPRALGPQWSAGEIRDLDIVIAYEEDLSRIMAFQESRDIGGLMRYIERGRVNEVGDGIAPAPLRRT